MDLRVFALLILGNVLLPTECANILAIFHYPSKSHQLLGESLLISLAKHGHNVTMLSPFSMKKSVANYTNIQLEDMIQYKEKNMKQIVDNQKGSFMDTFLIMMKSVEETVVKFFDNKATQDLLASDSKFDVVIINWVMSEALLGIAHHYGAPVIAFSPIGASSYLNYLTGAPVPYAYVPNMALNFSDEMTFLQRVTNTLMGVFGTLLMEMWFLPNQKSVLETHFPNAPPLMDLLDNVDLVLANSHVVLESPRPYVPHVIPIGGFYLEDVEELSKDMKTILDSSKSGVIYFSLGTNIQSSTLPPELLRALMDTFAKVPYDILWKFEDDNLPGKPANVHIRTWVPQKAVLLHTQTKMFITHGGLGGVTEALYFGVPIIGIPFFGDQERNMADAVQQGFALKIKSTELTEETLTNAIREISENPTYKSTAEQLSSMFRNQPMSPTKKAVFWVEHVIEHKGAKHLKIKANKLSWYQYFLLDVIAFLCAIVLLSVTIIYLIAKTLLGLCFKRNKGPNKKLKRN